MAGGACLFFRRCGEAGCLGSQVMPFAEVGGAGGGSTELGGGGLRVTGLFQEVGTDGVEAVVAAGPLVQAGKQGEASAWPAGHCCGGGPGKPHHRGSGPGFEQIVEGQDLGPVGGGAGGGLVVEGCDGCLQLVLASVSPAQRPGDQDHSLGDEVPVPAGAILFGEGDQLAAGTAAGGAPGIGEQHQGEQPARLWV